MSWQEFKKKTASIDQQYNRRWLKTEYDHTVASANMTEKWQKFQEQKHLYPNLRYETVGDAKVRPEHQVWDGVVLPIDHPFWNTRYPPNDWGCRCDVVQTDEAPAERPVNQGKVPRNFSHNPARSGQIFKDPAYAQQLSKDQLKTAYALAKTLLRQEAGKDFLPTLRKERKEIKVLAKKRLVGKTVTHDALDKPIHFTMTGIKEALNQPHQHILEKNRAVKNIDKIIPKGIYIRTDADNKGKNILYHYLKIELAKEDSFIVIKEDVNKNEAFFYSITDKIKK